MTNNIFSQYQRKNLLPSLGGDDTIFIKLQDAAEEIAEDLSENRSKIPIYALVAFDNQITETEPVLADVEAQIQAHWQMLRSQFTDMPISLYRAIILRAFEHLITEETDADCDEDTATIIYLSVNDAFPFINFTQQEHDILTTFLQEIGDLAEEKAIQEWSVDKNVEEVAITSLKIKTQVGSITITEEEMKGAIYVPAQPRQYNNLNLWVEPFFSKANSGLANLLTQKLVEQSKELNTSTAAVQTELNTFFKSLNKNLQTALKHNIQSALAVEQRSQLLWWKETMYSRKLHKSYRKLTKLECTVAMAVDLYEILPDIYPISVDYILREAFWQIHGHENEITLIDFLDEINDSKNEVFLKIYFEEIKINAGRTDLVSFLKRIIYSKMNIKKELPTSIGIDASSKITYEDISVWILHCFSTQYLTQD
jgi:hypothetical protein